MANRPMWRGRWASAAALACALTLPMPAAPAWGRAPHPPRATGSARRLAVQVQGVPAGDTLNIRRTASPRGEIVARIPPDAEVVATGRTRRYRSTTWAQVEYQGAQGWVNARFVSGPAVTREPATGRGRRATLASVAPVGPAADSDGKDRADKDSEDPKEKGEGSEKKIGSRDRRAGASPVEYPGEKQFFQCKKLPDDKAVLKLNLKPDTEITDLIGWMSAISCTPFLLPAAASLKGKKVTVISPRAVTVGESYRLFHSALDSVGLTVEPSGKFLRIVEEARTKPGRLPFFGPDDEIPRDKRLITKLVRLRNLDGNELTSGVLTRIKSDFGEIIPYHSSLIISDTAENVDRITRIINQFDVPSGMEESLWMIRIKNMSATEMGTRLANIVPVQQAVLGGRGGGGGGGAAAPGPGPGRGGGQWVLSGGLGAEMAISKVVADERSNSLIVVGNRRAYDWLITLVRTLDRPPEGGKNGNGRVHVYYCENANCDELAATLSAVAGVQVVGSTGNARRTRPAPGGGPAPFPAPPPAAPPGAPAAPALLMFEGDVRITFDAPTNSLLVVSSFKDFQALRAVIEKLDGPRKQVFIEATILEVLLDKARDVGVAYHGGKPVGFPGNEQSLLLGGFEASKTLTPGALISNLGGLTGALFGPTIPSQDLQIFGTSLQLPSFGVFLQLLQTNNDVNVLSNPSLLITNNQEGEISVGENLPFPAQLLGGFPGPTPGPPGAPGLAGFQSFPSVGVQRQNVALTMKITPSVNEHDIIRLDVDQVIEDVAAANFNGLGPATSKRSAKTEVVARDQQTVVIGGLMTDRQSETVKKVPILGDIPVLGFFFRSTSKTTKKANIVIALTPYVISDLSDLRRIAEKKLRERREFIDRYSAIEDKAHLAAAVTYGRTRGMLAEINRAATEVEEEEAELRRVRARDDVDDATEIEPPGRQRNLAGAYPRYPVWQPAPGAVPVEPPPTTGAPAPSSAAPPATSPPPGAASPPPSGAGTGAGPSVGGPSPGRGSGPSSPSAEVSDPRSPGSRP